MKIKVVVGIFFNCFLCSTRGTKMMLLILLCAVVLARATSIPDNCNGIKVGNSPVLYEREVLTSDVNYPHSLAVDHSTNILYFVYRTDYHGSSTFAKIDLNDKELKNITSVPVFGAVAVDNAKSEVYVAGWNKIYKYYPKTDTAEVYAANNDKTIHFLHFHDYLYYTVYPAGDVYVVKNGKDVTAEDAVRSKVDHFVIDKDGDMFYSARGAVYGIKKGTPDVDLYGLTDESGVSYLTTDKYGEVYVMTNDGLYVVNKNEKRLDYFLKAKNYYSITFDKNNNILYGDEHNIYILKPNLINIHIEKCN